MPDYSKTGNGSNTEPPKPSMPRPTPAQLAKRQREVNHDRLVDVEKKNAQEELKRLDKLASELEKAGDVVPKGKRTKDEREREFIMSVEMVLGHPLFEWQKEWLKEIRKASFEGKALNITIEDVRRRRGY